MREGNPNPTVLFIDDEPALLDVYESFLEQRYAVLTATGGEEALALLDKPESIDVVMLDRRMPDTSGDEVLATIRERGNDVPVGIVSGIEPNVDIIGMPIDAYLSKPIEFDQLQDTVERLVAHATLDEKTRKFCCLTAKKEIIETAGTTAVKNSVEFHELLDRLQRLRTELIGTAEEQPGLNTDALCFL